MAQNAAVRTESQGSITAPVRQSRASGSIHTVPGTGGTLAALERALQVLLSPMDYPDWRAWRREVHERLLELTGAERMAMYTPLGESNTDAWMVPGMTAEWASLPHPEPRTGSSTRTGGFALVSARTGAGGPPHYHDTGRTAAVHHPTSAGTIVPPQGSPTRDVAAIEVDFGAGKPALLAFTDGRHRWWRPDAERVATLRAVLPALKAGLTSWRRAAEQRRELTRLVDALPDAVLLFDRGGTLLHANAAGRALLAEADGARVRNEAQRVAWAVDAVVRRGRAADASTAASTTRELKLGEQGWQLRGIAAPEALRGADGAVLVLVDRVVRAALSDDDLRARFQLTAREIEVARLVGQGLSNQEIADKLGVSFFTARNHVERLLVKLGVGGRAKVAALLSGG